MDEQGRYVRDWVQPADELVKIDGFVVVDAPVFEVFSRLGIASPVCIGVSSGMVHHPMSLTQDCSTWYVVRIAVLTSAVLSGGNVGSMVELQLRSHSTGRQYQVLNLDCLGMTVFVSTAM